jgi:sugar diacid utilization regulator
VTAAALPGLPAGSTAGISGIGTGAAELAARWRQAQVAAAVAAVAPRLSPVAAWDELGSWRLVSALEGPDPAVVPLLAEPVLATTAEVWLDCAGSAGRTAEALCVHRQTLYYRLGRIEALTGLHLADGDARLLLHASLKRARLSI